MSKLENNSIYIPLQGRIGNQLFQYAYARMIQIEKGINTKIVIDDSDVLRCGWENSLIYYNLPNVEFIHVSIAKKKYFFTIQSLIRNVYKVLIKKMDYKTKYSFEKKVQAFLNKQGIVLCENGYIEADLDLNKPNYLEGYFQSEKYFNKYGKDIRDILSKCFTEQVACYPNIEKIRNRNTV